MAFAFEKNKVIKYLMIPNIYKNRSNFNFKVDLIFLLNLTLMNLLVNFETLQNLRTGLNLSELIENK